MKRIGLLAVVVLLACAVSAQADMILPNFQVAGYTQTINGAIFTNINPRSTGTGFVDPFLKFTDNGPTEQAYNYDSFTLRDLQPTGSFGSGNWTNLLWSPDLAITNEGGIDYWTFVLDIDQAPGGNPYYSLNQLVLFWSASGAENPGTGLYPAIPNLGTAFYNMDLGADGDVALGLNYSLNTGSGSGDLKVLIPVAATLPERGAYIYLYHASGFTGGDYVNNNGPDEWWAYSATAPPEVPEPASLLLLGTGLVGLGRLCRRRKR